jgi:hypothetical protein
MNAKIINLSEWRRTHPPLALHIVLPLDPLWAWRYWMAFWTVKP